MDAPMPGHRSCVVKIVGKNAGGPHERATCFYLADGSKIVLCRAPGVMGEVWMEQVWWHPSVGCECEPEEVGGL